MRKLLEAGLMAAVLASGFLTQVGVSNQSAVSPEGRPVSEFLMVPVRVHLLRSKDSAAVGTRLTALEVERIFRKANGIWHAAGVHLWPESVVSEDADNIAGTEKETAVQYNELLPLRPRGSRAEDMFHVYYIRAMVVNGIFIRRDAIFVQEVAALRPVPGGIDEPLPRVTSHELGHALGLPHRQDRTNLMASGTTGTSLNDDEIHTARHTAESLKWVESSESFLKKADALAAEDKKEAAASRYRAIVDLPGTSDLKARAKSKLSVTDPH